MAAFIGSLVLLVGTVISIVNRRDDLSKEYDLQLTAASSLATNGVAATIDRAVAIASVAPAEIDPESLDLFSVSVDVCVVDPGDRAVCNGEDLTEIDAYRSAEQELAGLAPGVARRAVAVVDGDNDCVLVVGGGAHRVAIRLPADALLDEQISDTVGLYAADVAVTVLPTLDETGVATDGIDSIGGERRRISMVENPPDVGVVEVTVAADPQIGIMDGIGRRYLAVLGLGTILLAVAAWTVIAERRRLERRATTDEMTGLLNRREFERQCEDAIINADRFRTGLCIMLLDLDGFKAINDTRGHHVGDQVLIETARRLEQAVRDTDVVSRWGGDEFVILLPGLEQTTAVRNSAERIGAGLSDTTIVDDITITGSIGAALYPRHGVTFDELIRAADGAMYAAKTTGVTHRLADALSGDDPGGTGGTGADYDGPERRRTPAPSEPVA
ncbi:MAG: GGDEF domain-containing protein [Acidimicrobiia bacterium]|nr:GGDEF domain-containing protein [Acidimicrobiia bacterium]